MPRDRIPTCRVCGYRADQCHQIRTKFGQDHAYEGEPWTPPEPEHVQAHHRQARRKPRQWPRPYKED